jgi:shikimate kinase
MVPIFLVGFMGCGKTTIGGAVAERLGVPFIDLDEKISERLGVSIAEAFARHGEAAFRAAETAALEHVAADQPGVVATGGGCFCSERNRQVIEAAGGRSVYLEVPWPKIAERLGASDPERPLFADQAGARELFEQRAPIYQLAAVTVRLSGCEGPGEAVARVLDALQRVPEAECAT